MVFETVNSEGNFLQYRRSLMLPFKYKSTGPCFMGSFRFVFALGIFVAICVDCGLYAKFTNAHLPNDGDQSTWFVYGQNLACLLALVYFVWALACCYKCPPSGISDNVDVHPVPQRFVYLWMLHTCAFPLMTVALIVYARINYDATYRWEECGMIVWTFLCCLFDYLLGAHPLLPGHWWVPTVLVLFYMCLLALASANRNIYPLVPWQHDPARAALVSFEVMLLVIPCYLIPSVFSQWRNKKFDVGPYKRPYTPEETARMFEDQVRQENV